MKRFCRLIFSRYFFSAIMIVLELSVLLLWLFGIWQNSIYALIIGYLVNFIAVLNLITKDTNPEYKIPWLIILIAVPLFGTVLYTLFYSRPMSRREGELMKELYYDLKGQEDKEVLEKTLLELRAENERAAGDALSILNDDAFSKIYRDSGCSYLKIGEEYFEKMLFLISRAKRFVFLEYFIISEGNMLSRLLDVLFKKADSGVEVRIMYDDLGSMKTLSKKFEKALQDSKISALRFNKISPSLSTAHNNRNHRKICVIDGEWAFTGGVNIADEYINEKARFGHFKDGGVLVFGHAVEGFTRQFLCDWALVKKEKEDMSGYLSSFNSAEISDTGYYIPFGSGPKPTYKREVGKRAILNLVNRSEKYLFITTPYLIIDHELTEAIRGAARRGVFVKIITPKIPDKRIIKIMTKSSYPYLLESGVKIYEYTPGFIHEKLIICDDVYMLTGTINLDYRSLVHHYENALWIYNSKEILTARDEFLKTISLSKEIEKSEAELNRAERLIRSLVRVFAPLL